MTAPQVVVLGGPNGAGKSTVAPELVFARTKWQHLQSLAQNAS